MFIRARRAEIKPRMQTVIQLWSACPFYGFSPREAHETRLTGGIAVFFVYFVLKLLFAIYNEERGVFSREPPPL